MWIMTKAGFFSAVEDRENHEYVLVRARQLKDLVNLTNYLDGAHDIIAKEDSDYRFRIRVTKTQWADAVAQFSNDIDYSNFKAKIWEIDRKRADVYGDIWAILYKLQLEDDN